MAILPELSIQCKTVMTTECLLGENLSGCLIYLLLQGSVRLFPRDVSFFHSWWPVAKTSEFPMDKRNGWSTWKCLRFKCDNLRFIFFIFAGMPEKPNWLYISATNPVIYIYNPTSVANVHEKRFSETPSLCWQY